jgi:hypothetical protein
MLACGIFLYTYATYIVFPCHSYHQASQLLFAPSKRSLQHDEHRSERKHNCLQLTLSCISGMDHCRCLLHCRNRQMLAKSTHDVVSSRQRSKHWEARVPVLSLLQHVTIGSCIAFKRSLGASTEFKRSSGICLLGCIFFQSNNTTLFHLHFKTR